MDDAEFDDIFGNEPATTTHTASEGDAVGAPPSSDALGSLDGDTTESANTTNPWELTLEDLAPSPKAEKVAEDENMSLEQRMAALFDQTIGAVAEDVREQESQRRDELDRSGDGAALLASQTGASLGTDSSATSARPPLSTLISSEDAEVAAAAAAAAAALAAEEEVEVVVTEPGSLGVRLRFHRAFKTVVLHQWEPRPEFASKKPDGGGLVFGGLPTGETAPGALQNAIQELANDALAPPPFVPDLGDVIVAVDGVSIVGLPFKAAIERIKAAGLGVSSSSFVASAPHESFDSSTDRPKKDATSPGAAKASLDVAAKGTGNGESSGDGGGSGGEEDEENEAEDADEDAEAEDEEPKPAQPFVRRFRLRRSAGAERASFAEQVAAEDLAAERRKTSEKHYRRTVALNSREAVNRGDKENSANRDAPWKKTRSLVDYFYQAL